MTNLNFAGLTRFRAAALRGVALAAVAFPFVSHAQDIPPSAETTEAEVSDAEIVVTGIRRSIEQSINVKRDAAGVVDAITAEDVGKLPDQNVVETLQRITGVQIARARGGTQQNPAGEGQSFTIRGISQNRVEFNGSNLTGAATSGGVQLSDFNPDILASLTVTKTPSAEDIEGALGGVVNVITRKPLAMPKFFASARAEGIHYDQAGKIGYRVSGLVSARLSDSLGVLFGASRYDYIRDTYAFTSDGYTTTNLVDVTGDGVADRGLIRPNRAVLDSLRANQKRTGVHGAVQWKPSDSFELNVDAAFTDFNMHQDANRYQILLTDRVTGGRANDAGTLYAGTYENVTPRVAVYSEPYKQKQQVYSLSSRWEASDRLRIDFKAAHSEGQQSFNVDTPLLIPKPGMTSSVFVDLQAPTDLPTVRLTTNYDIMNPGNYRLDVLGEARNLTDNEGNEIRLDATYKTGLNWIESFKMGGRYESVSLSTDRFARNITAADLLAANRALDRNGDGLIGVEEMQGISIGDLQGGSIFPGKSGDIVRNFLGGRVDVDAIRASLGLGDAPRDLAAVRAVTGESFAGFVQARIEGRFIGLPIKGNIGVRYVDYKRIASGYVIGVSNVYVDYATRFRNWLPSMNVNADLTSNLKIRFAAARVISYPQLTQVAPGVSLNVIRFTGSRGNPYLKPFTATQYDTSLEWYFAPSSILSLAAFYKNVDSFTVSQSTVEYFDNGAYSGNYTISEPVNGQNGTIKGFEVGYQQAFRGLPKFLDGLGAGLSYTYTDSKTPSTDPATGKPYPMPGLSKHSFNATIFLEQDWGDIRATYNWRDTYLDANAAATIGGPLYQRAYGGLDLTSQFNLTKKAKAHLTVVNVLKNSEMIYMSEPNRIRDITVHDRRIYAGVSATF